MHIFKLEQISQHCLYDLGSPFFSHLLDRIRIPSTRTQDLLVWWNKNHWVEFLTSF